MTTLYAPSCVRVLCGAGGGWTGRFFSADAAAAGTPYSALTVGIPKERFPLEKRVAATPESVKRLVAPGFKVIVEDNAGAASYFSNADYEAAGAQVVKDIWSESDIVLKVKEKSKPMFRDWDGWSSLVGF
jgi:hypothetical protein